MNELVNMGLKVWRDDRGNPIARGQLFVAQGGTNNLVYVFLDAEGLRSTKSYPMILGADGTVRFWLPRGRTYHITVRNEFGSLVLYEDLSFSPEVMEASVPTSSTSSGNKTFTYTGGKLTQVDTFTDATRTVLSSRKILEYAGDGKLTTVKTYDASLVLLTTRTIEYTGNVISGMTQV